MPFTSSDDFFYNPNPPPPKDTKEMQRWVGVLEREIERLTGDGQEDSHAGVNMAFYELLRIGEPETARVMITLLTRNPKTSAWERFKRTSPTSSRAELSYLSDLESMVAHSDDRYIVDLILDALVKAENFEQWQLKSLIFFFHRKPDPRSIRPLLLALEHGEMRGEAARALGEIKDSRATLPLIKYLGETSSRQSIMEALADIGDVRAIEALIPYLDDVNRFIRDDARKALFRLGYVRPVDTLRDLVQNGNHEQGYEALSGLGLSNNPDALEIIIEATKSKTSDLRKHAISVLADLNDKRAADTLIAALSNDDELIRHYAIHGVMLLEDVRAVPALLQIVKTDEMNAAYAADVIGRLGDSSAFLPLMEALTHPNSNVRACAAGALGKLGNAEAIPAIVPLLDDERTYRSAHRALTQLGYQFEG